MQHTFKMDSGLYEFMGSSNDTRFSADGRSIIYLNGPATTVVMLICAQTNEELHTYSLQEPDRIVLAFYSPEACLKRLNEPDVCVQKGPCSCEFSNGTGYDLSPTAKNSFYMTRTYEVYNNGSQYSLSSYFYHPCYDVQPKFNTTSPYSTCGMPLSICRYISNFNIENVMQHTFKMDSGLYEFIGSSNDTRFSDDGRSIIYLNGPASTVVMLICAQTNEELHTYSLQEPDRIVLKFYSPEACLKQLKKPGSLNNVIPSTTAM